MILQKAYCTVLSLLMAMSLCVFSTGCSQKSFNSTVAKIQGQIPNAEALLSEISVLVGNSKVGSVGAEIIAGLNVDLPAFADQVNSYLASKSKGISTVLVSAAQTLQSDVTKALLAANKITDPATQASVLAKIAEFGIAVTGFATLLSAFTGSAANVINIYRESIQPYTQQSAEEQMAEAYGYTLGQLGL